MLQFSFLFGLFPALDFLVLNVFEKENFFCLFLSFKNGEQQVKETNVEL